MTKSAYLHIPFCEHICTYCDFCKRYYDEELASAYLDILKREVQERYRGERLNTIYIGGGTPSALSTKNLDKLMKIITLFKLEKNYEMTMELNPENITQEKLAIMKKYGVNRISVGVETTKDKYLSYLGRKHNFSNVQEKIALIKKMGFQNINVDLIYAIPSSTIDDLKEDLDNLLKLDINHISTYSLMINDNTILGIKKELPIQEEIDFQMYDYLRNYLRKHGFNHYEISNFAKPGYESRHNLVYWQNEEYYGFGLGASGYVNNIRYDNTKSMNKYLNMHYIQQEECLTLKDKISYELILGFRIINGINKEDFYQKYHQKLEDLYSIKEMIEKGYLEDNGSNIMISYDKIYIENSILVNFI